MISSGLKVLWPTVIFFICIGLLAFSLSTSIPTEEGFFCAQDDKVIAVCIRNWANASGNLLTGIVAVIAAIFAYRQLKSSDKQVSSSLLPFLEKRLETISEMYKMSESVHNDFYELGRLVGEYQLLLLERVVPHNLISQHVQITRQSDALKKSRDKLRNYAGGIHIDNDIADIGSLIVEISYHLSDNAVVNLFSEINSTNRQLVAGDEPTQNVVDRSRQKQFYFERAFTVMNRKLDQIIQHKSKLSALAQKVKERRVLALGLGGGINLDKSVSN